MEKPKVYVSVIAEFTIDGDLIPKSLLWEDGHVYDISKVIDVRRAASTRAGGVGLRYTCLIDSKVSHIFYEENNLWFVERKGQAAAR